MTWPAVSAPLLRVSDIRTVIAAGGQTAAAVDGVSFEVSAGEIVAIVGETGSGKSLTALSLLRLLRYPVQLESGVIELAGEDLALLSPRELRRIRGSGIGMIFQDPMTALNPFMTVRKQLAETIRLKEKLAKRELDRKIIGLLTDVGIVNPKLRIDQYPHELSGGTQQRVMIAMALANKPKLLIADEPTTSLDATVQAQILQLIKAAARQREMGVLLITHDLGVVAGTCDRTLVMYAGQIVESGSTEVVLREAAHPYTRALLEATPRIDVEHRRLAYIPGRPPELFALPTGCRFAPRCPQVTDKCRTEPPLLERRAGSAEVLVRCWYPITATPTATALLDSPVPPEPEASSLGAPATESGSALRVRGLQRHFAVGRGRETSVTKAVDGVSLDLAFSETLGVVGESGCGKSTLAKVLAGLDLPTAGTVERGDVSARSDLRRGRAAGAAFVQYVFQDTFGSLDPRRNIMQTIAEPLVNMTTMNQSQRRQRVREYMSACGLPESLEGRYPHELSGGQRQRVGICRALVVRPRVVVMDEPMSGLDVSVQAQIVNLLQDLKGEFGLTSVLISHDIGVIRHLCDRVAVMYLGRVVEVGTTDELMKRPLHPYTAALMSAVPLPDPVLEEARTPILLRGDVGDVNPTSCCAFSDRCPAVQDKCISEPLHLRLVERGLQVSCHYPGAISDQLLGANTAAPPLVDSELR